MRLIRWALPLALAVAIAAAGLAIYQGVGAMFPKPADPPVVVTTSEGQWQVMRTPGGLLEVSTIEAKGEVIERRDFAKFGPIDLGTNVSHVRLPATYRYHIPLAPEWKVAIKDGTLVVVAPRVRPTLPVAFDSSKVYKRVDAGWLRFDKLESLKTTEAAITAELAKRAASPNAIAQQREVARATVTDFAEKWIAGQRTWKNGAPKKVQVIFADEPIDSLGSVASMFSAL